MACAASKPAFSHRLVTFVVLAAALACSTAAAPGAGVGRIVGNIDGISQDGDHFFISGWACQQGQRKSIAVHVFGEDLKQPSKRTLLLVQFANLYSEPAVGQACRDHNGEHRFMILLPYGYGPQSKIWVHGIRVVEGVANEAIAGSAEKLSRLPGPLLPYPAYPRLAGSYRRLTEHPGVFTTPPELKDLAARINRPDSYSMARFGQLADQIKRDLASGINWDITYSGCHGVTYNYTFSYEPQDHNEAGLRSTLQLPPGAKYPTGAAVVASRLALYAALVKAGAVAPPGSPSADQATSLAKRILLAWADHGFPRDAHGHIVSLLTKACRGNASLPLTSKPITLSTGVLELGRGVVYSVHAQDLLQYLGALNAEEERRLGALHGGLFDLIREALNGFWGAMVFPYPAAARYGNVPTNAVASLLATARLRDDERQFNAVLYGIDPSIPVLLPWTRLFDRIIYGESDSIPESGQNRFSDSLTSLKNHTDYQGPNVAPGEIADRTRGAYELQGIGYPMFTLERLIDAAEVMRIAGFDPYGYRGRHRQSIEMAIAYYACFARHAGFYKIVSADNSAACPDAAQYYGKLVNAVDPNVVIGAHRFPTNRAITEVEDAAKALPLANPPTTFSTDAILFGKWRD
jgi:hypothetical protein